MSIAEQIDRDLKQALLSGEKDKATTLRGLKSVLLNEAIAKNIKEQGLSNEQAIAVIQREAKKRQDSADIYNGAHETERANKELTEKAILEDYLPSQMGDEELMALVDEAIKNHPSPDIKAMGQIIGVVKAQAGATADGGRIASLVKQRLKP